MAQSPAHKLGQLVGMALETTFKSVLSEFCRRHNLFLDTNGPRPGVRRGKKVSWRDKYGNSHDLDFVIERHGAPDIQGRPVAFIEAAWRRYTKHSRNKCQEIQGAVLPLAETYTREKPFLGALLAGRFTAQSVEQLQSHGFVTLYVDYSEIVKVFSRYGVGIDLGEDASEQELREAVESVTSVMEQNGSRIRASLVAAMAQHIVGFVEQLTDHVVRNVERILVVPLFGSVQIFTSASAARRFIDRFDETEGSDEFGRYEMRVTFTNGDEISGTFSTKERATEFLRHVCS